MTIAAGAKVDASDYSTGSETSTLGGDLAGTTAWVDTGLTTTVVTSRDNQTVVILLDAYITCATATANHAWQARYDIDGTPSTSYVRTSVPATYWNGAGYTQSGHWTVVIPTAGTHTIKIQHQVSTNSDFTIKGTHSRLSVIPVLA